MPKRRTVITVTCDEVQGEGSWVKLRVLAYKESRAMLATLHERRQQSREQHREDKEEFGDSDLAGVELSPEEMDETVRVYVDHIIAWNWVDDEECPLPQPNEVENLLDLLNQNEISFLGQKLVEGKGNQKN